MGQRAYKRRACKQQWRVESLLTTESIPCRGGTLGLPTTTAVSPLYMWLCACMCVSHVRGWMSSRVVSKDGIPKRARKRECKRQKRKMFAFFHHLYTRTLENQIYRRDVFTAVVILVWQPTERCYESSFENVTLFTTHYAKLFCLKCTKSSDILEQCPVKTNTGG